MTHLDHLVSLAVYHQQPSIKLDQFLLVIEVLLDNAADAAHHPCRNVFYRIERRHEDQKRNVSVACQI